MPGNVQQSSLLGGEALDPSVAFNNNLYLGKVIDVYPERNIIDVILMNGGFVREVQVLTNSGTSRSGLVDLVKVDYSDDAEFIPTSSQDTINDLGVTDTTGERPRVVSSDREVTGGYNAYAIIAFLQGQMQNPICIGFIYPETSEMMFFEQHYIDRHDSDVYTFIDGKGNFEKVFPDGTYLRVGEGTDREDLVRKDVNEKWTTKADDPATQDAPKSLHIEHTSGTKLTINPDGSVDVLVTDNSNVVVQGNKSVTIEGDNSATIEGNNTLLNEVDYDITTEQDKTEIINGNDNLTVEENKVETISGNSTENVTGTKNITAQQIDLEAAILNNMCAQYALQFETGVITGETLVMGLVSLAITAPTVNILSASIGLGPVPTFGALVGELHRLWAISHEHPTSGGPPITVPPPASTTVRISI